ncbi:aspartate/glutamate racemase family protein [Paracoccus sp. JM45]|uniref:aspartate/glutamate racemase family protein n=1 Tax=Paracoccus sp. JM45 TaxID=2283626 RepID=UPI000E6B5D58|nr:aspartate/glutamate racemase family protein [Paracoccus sp. JM45]RJE79880.1 HyuE hydantoin racemase [Paracoccus sp. JM45]
MRLLYINPNSTRSMTDGIVTTARAAAPQAQVIGWTNDTGPKAIQGAADGEAAVAGLLSLLPQAESQAVDAIVIACFDDTGLARIRAAAHCPVIGIGQAAMSVAALNGGQFGIITTLDVSVPVISENVGVYGLGDRCAGVFASGLPVLQVEAGGGFVVDRLADTLETACRAGAQTVVLGCAGMSGIRTALAARSGVALIDGVTASAHLACALVQ